MIMAKFIGFGWSNYPNGVRLFDDHAIKLAIMLSLTGNQTIILLDN